MNNFVLAIKMLFATALLLFGCKPNVDEFSERLALLEPGVEAVVYASILGPSTPNSEIGTIKLAKSDIICLKGAEYIHNIGRYDRIIVAHFEEDNIFIKFALHKKEILYIQQMQFVKGRKVLQISSGNLKPKCNVFDKEILSKIYELPVSWNASKDQRGDQL